MTLYKIETGNFKLDGGAMFGVVPKTIWSRTNPADNDNLIGMSARSLLIEDGNRLILVDTGMGNKQSDKFFSYYHLWGEFSLEKSLQNHGFSKEDITDVFLTHLHFDHCGGCIVHNDNGIGYRPNFKNAKYWSNRSHWDWAVHPNPREKASFLKENLLPLEESGQLNFVEVPKESRTTSDEFKFDILFVDGHTEKQMLPILKYKEHILVFAADLIPTAGHVPLPYVMGYDTRPLKTMKEKGAFLEEAADKGYLLFMEHDPHNEICTVKKTERGVRLDKTYRFDEIFN